jgi:hypothetical protein
MPPARGRTIRSVVCALLAGVLLAPAARADTADTAAVSRTLGTGTTPSTDGPPSAPRTAGAVITGAADGAASEAGAPNPAGAPSPVGAEAPGAAPAGGTGAVTPASSAASSRAIAALPRLPLSDPLNGGFLIVNIHGLLFHERDSDIQEDAAYARWLGARVIRVFGTDNNGLRQWDGARVGTRIAEVAPLLRTARVRLIVAFVNNHRAVPGEAPDASGWLDNYSQLLLPFYTTDWRGSYRQFVRDLITTVQSRGALDVVQAWELGNELHTPQEPSALKPFILDAVTEVRTLDPTTPILPGTMGANHVEPWNRASPIARWLYCEAPIDAYTLHAYDWLSRDRPGDMPIDWDLDIITAEPCPDGRQLPVIVEELGTSRELPGAWGFDDEQRRFEQEVRQIQFVRGFPRVVGFGVWNGESPRLIDKLFFDSRRGLTSFGPQARGGGSCYDPRPEASPGVRCQLEQVLRGIRFLRVPPSGEWAAGSGADGARALLGGVDLPTADAGATIPLTGWVLDPVADASSGVDTLNLFLGGPSDNGPLLGQAKLGQARPDVASRFEKSEWTGAGFTVDLPISALPSGLTTLTLSARSASRGTWLSTVQVIAPELGSRPPATTSTDAPLLPRAVADVIGPSPPRVQLDAPKAGATLGRSAQVQGVVYEPGVDRVDVFLEPGRDRGGRLVGSAVVRQPTPARFTATINVPPGPHTLYVHVHSVTTGREQVVSVAVEGAE